MAKKLLLADDSITIQKVVGITFAQEDFDITYVDNGVDAIQKAQELKPDIVLADIVMPQKTGYDVCEAIKQSPDMKHIPVLLLAGTFETFDVNRGKMVGADDYIIKPFESQALIDKVNSLLSGAPAAEAQPSAAATPEPAAPAPIPETAAPDEATMDFGGDVGADDFGGMAEADLGAGDELTNATAGEDIPTFDVESVVSATPESEEQGETTEAAFNEDNQPVSADLPEVGEQDFQIASAAEIAMDLPNQGGDTESAEDLPPVTAPADEFGLGDFSTDDVSAGSSSAPDFSLDSDTPSGSESAVDADGLDGLGLPPLPDDTVAQEDDGLAMDASAFEATPDISAPPSNGAAAQVSIDEGQVKEVIEAKVREILERVAWEVIPDLAERIIRDEIKKITDDK